MANPLIKYIGRPYDKYNCFDLVKEFYKDHFDIDLSNYWEQNNTPDRRVVQTLIASNKGDFIDVSKEVIVLGDIVIVKLYGLECHVGVCVGNGMFLHSIRGVGSCMEHLKKYEKMIAGYYRHKGEQE